MTPALALVSGSGLTREARTEWLKSAYLILGDVRPDVLAAATKIAMRTVDHPSRIVPAILRESDRIEGEQQRQAQRDAAIAETRDLIENHNRPNPEAAEVGSLMADLVRKLEARA